MASALRIPYPALTQRYVDLKDRPSAERLASARTTTAAELAAEFLDAAAALERFDVEGDGRDTRFYPPTRTDGPKHAKSHTRTYGWAMAIKGTGVVEVDGARELDFRYVAREIIPTRKPPLFGPDVGESWQGAPPATRSTIASAARPSAKQRCGPPWRTRILGDLGTTGNGSNSSRPTPVDASMGVTLERPC